MSFTDSSRQDSLDVAGVLGAAVAHELRNMLASVSSSIFLAKRDLDKRDRLTSHLDSAEDELIRAQDVIERVLRLVRGEPIHREMCRLVDVVSAAQRNVRGTSVKIDVDITPPDLEVSCEPLLLERLMTNLFSNAIDALRAETSGRIVVRGFATGFGAKDAEGDLKPQMFKQERGFCVEVEDNGPGFAPEVLAKLFQPGVTTKSTGTGLGLLLCRSIARVHSGDMSVGRSGLGGASVRCEFA